ncbi:MAG: class F sortase, partial [Chloroflexota bacterium]|nr:class F sortase [Chloroflexota bacterium]
MATTGSKPAAVATTPPDSSVEPTETPAPEVVDAADLKVTPTTSGDRAALPVRFKINTERVKVDAAVEHVGLTEDRAMDVPKAWENVAWYKLGPMPGEKGNSVIAGHLDSKTGPAVFSNLQDLQVGDVVSVVDESGETTRFKVRKMEVYY